MGLYIEEKRREHADRFLSRYIALYNCQENEIGPSHLFTYDFRFKNKERMEFFEFWRFSEDFLGDIELPCKTVWIPC